MVPLIFILAGLGQGASPSGLFHHHAAAMLEAVAAEAPPAEAQVLRALAASERGVADSGQTLQPVCFVRNGYAVLANDRLGLLFRLQPDQAQLRAIYHVPRRYQFVRWADGPTPFWEVAYWDPQDRNTWQEIIDSTQPAQVSWQTGETRGVSASLQIRWRFERPRRLTVSLSVSLGLHQAEARLVQAILGEARKVEPAFIVLGEEFHEANVGQSYTATLHQPFFSPDVWQEVPMLQVVYGRYYKLFGSKPSQVYSKPCGGAADVPGTHPPWGLDIARNLAWGDLVAWVPSYVMNAYDYAEIEEQIGWKIRPQIEFLRHAAAVRRAAAKYLVFGQMLRPPPARHDAAPPARWDYSLVTIAFRADDGTVAFVFVNARFDRTLKASFTLRPDEYGLPADGSWTLSRMDERGQLARVRMLQGPACEQKVWLPPLGAAVFTAAPKRAQGTSSEGLDP